VSPLSPTYTTYPIYPTYTTYPTYPTYLTYSTYLTYPTYPTYPFQSSLSDMSLWPHRIYRIYYRKTPVVSSMIVKLVYYYRSVKLAMDNKLDVVFLAKGPELSNEKGRPILDGDPVHFKPVARFIFKSEGRLTAKAVLVSGLPETMPEDCYVMLHPISSGERCHALRFETDNMLSLQFGCIHAL
jgi:hypothetical protein